MNLERFIVALGPGEVVNGAPAGAASVEISDLAYDTRTVTPGALFFCVRGRNVDGHAFAATAAALGAAALVVEHPVEVDAAAARRRRRAVGDAGRRDALLRRSLARARRRRGHRNEREDDDSAFLLHSILEAAGRQTGLLTNIERRVGGEPRATGLNTPEAIDLQRLLREMADGGDQACVLEATSQAGAQGRLEGTRFAVLIFTNLTQDHLDFHGTMEAYYEAKAALFAQAERAVSTSATSGGGGSLRPSPTRSLSTRRPRMRSTGSSCRCSGAFNRENAIGAALAAEALGVDRDAIKRGIEAAAGRPGPVRDDRRRPAVHGDRRLRAHARLARERHPHGARPRRRPAHGRVRRRRRPRPGQAAADGPCGLGARRPRDPDLGQPAVGGPAAIAAEVAAGALGQLEHRARPARRDRARARARRGPGESS